MEMITTLRYKREILLFKGLSNPRFVEILYIECSNQEILSQNIIVLRDK